jgi:molecular chaperone DnaJ
MPCIRCGGSGQTIEHPCLSCKGEGIKTEAKQVSVKIPAGVRNMMDLRIQGQGNCGTRGGRNGDLFVTIKVKPHPYFTVVDEDVFVNVPLTIRDIVFGTTSTVQSVDGKSEMSVAIPPGTVPGSTRTLKFKGPPKPSSAGSRGDMILQFTMHIQPPETLTERQKEIINEFDSIQKVIMARQANHGDKSTK